MKLKNIFSVEIRLQKVTRNPCGERSLLSGNFFNYFFQKKLANPGLFLVYFWSFQTNNTVLTTHQCKKCPSSIWCWDSNPQPLEHELSPITPRPGLPPTFAIIFQILFNLHIDWLIDVKKINYQRKWVWIVKCLLRLASNKEAVQWSYGECSLCLPLEGTAWKVNNARTLQLKEGQDWSYLGLQPDSNQKCSPLVHPRR